MGCDNDDEVAGSLASGSEDGSGASVTGHAAAVMNIIVNVRFMGLGCEGYYGREEMGCDYVFCHTFQPFFFNF